MTAPEPRAWQVEALRRWEEAGRRGIVSVVTGGGKTIFALHAVGRLPEATALVVVPTAALQDQWLEESESFFGGLRKTVGVTSRRGLVAGAINVAVLNTAAALASSVNDGVFLVVDECHKAATAVFGAVLGVPRVAALGLSATPERQYDDGLARILVPALGPVIFEYSYRDALRDGVIVPFHLHNVVFLLEPKEAEDYDRLTKAIGRAVSRFGADSDEAVRLMLHRTRVLNLSWNRIRLAVLLVARHRGRRVLIFHEDTEACNVIHQVLRENGVGSSVYHSKLRQSERLEALRSYRRGDREVLVTCRALDEGFNVPETEIGIIAASTATRRQRIQRLGRVLRPAPGKELADIFTLIATDPEISRLREEQKELEGAAEVTWSQA